MASGLGIFLLVWFLAPVLESRWLKARVGALEAEPRSSRIQALAGAPDRLTPGSLLGRVRIDRLKIDAVVLAGIDAPILRRAVGHVPGTRLPWQAGTVGLAAHRDSFFRNLEGVRQGDLVLLLTEHGSWTYEVSDVRVVEPDEIGVLDDREEPGLTLVTCYPFRFLGPAPRRFVVLASRL